MGWLDRYGEYGQAEWLMRHIDEYKKYEVVCSKCGVRYIGNYDAYDEPCEFRYCPECGREITCVVILPKEGDKE